MQILLYIICLFVLLNGKTPPSLAGQHTRTHFVEELREFGEPGACCHEPGVSELALVQVVGADAGHDERGMLGELARAPPLDVVVHSRVGQRLAMRRELGIDEQLLTRQILAP